MACNLIKHKRLPHLIQSGAKKYRKIRDSNGNINNASDHHEFMHKKISKLWLRRFRLAFCCLAKDENGDEAFLQSAELFSNLFNGTDLVPTGECLLLPLNTSNLHKIM